MMIAMRFERHRQVMTLVVMAIVMGSVDCLSSSNPYNQQNRFIDIIAGHHQPSKLNLCMMNCGQCKEMYGDYFDGRRCAEFCLAATMAENDADFQIPDCNDAVAISQFLKLQINPSSDDTAAAEIVQELKAQQPQAPAPASSSSYSSPYYYGGGGMSRFGGGGGNTLKYKNLRRQQQEQKGHQFNNLLKPNRGGFDLQSGGGGGGIDGNSANWKKRISRNSNIVSESQQTPTPSPRFYLI